jgi:hypothetical protein
MLDLEPRIHLEKVELGAPDDELHGARVDISHRPRARHRGGDEPLLDAPLERGGRAFLDELLVAALDGALALVEVHDLAARIPEHLHLNVARLGEIALHEEGSRAEGGLGSPLGGYPRGRQRGGVRDPHHSDAASARRRLEHHGIADAARQRRRGLERVQCPLAPRHDRNARGLHPAARLHLVAHLLDDPPGRPDEDEPRLLAGLGEAPVLGQKAIAGMDALGAGLARGGENAIDAEIAVARRAGPMSTAWSASRTWGQPASASE